jgi:hypothetical protein
MRQQARTLLTLACLVTLAGCSSRPLPDACYLPPVSGQCRGAIERYYFDLHSNRCKAFIWGGCNGQVPFDTEESCTETCALSGHQPGNTGDQHE